jgi:hypothetical protein
VPGIFFPSRYPTISSRFSVEELAGAGIVLSPTLDEANVIVTALVEELSPFLQQYGSSKRYLVWCDEPLWSCMFQRLDTSRTAFLIPGNETAAQQYVTVDAMNCFTGSVLFCNHHFLLDTYHLDLANYTAMQSTDTIKLPAANERKIVAYFTYRNESKWNYEHPSGIFGLNTLRSRIAMEGRLFGKVDIFGQGWPLSLGTDDGLGPNNVDSYKLKLQRYKNYNFALCFENTWAPYISRVLAIQFIKISRTILL